MGGWEVGEREDVAACGADEGVGAGTAMEGVGGGWGGELRKGRSWWRDLDGECEGGGFG